jgi:hypothetical protein
MIDPSVLAEKTAALLEDLGRISEIGQFILVGGTALSLQLGHRISLDLDFMVPEPVLPRGVIQPIVSALKQQGHEVQLVTAPHLISAFKINTGLDLLDYAHDYVAGGVRLQFFARGAKQGFSTENELAFYRRADKIKLSNSHVQVLGLEGLKVAKTLVLAERVRSRDLFDLMLLMQKTGLTLQQCFGFCALSAVADTEIYKSVLSGDTPLDRDDEGLEPVGVEVSMAEIYRFFNQAIERYEIDLARREWLKALSIRSQ